jgi:hypothetical protein
MLKILIKYSLVMATIHISVIYLFELCQKVNIEISESRKHKEFNRLIKIIILT